MSKALENLKSNQTQADADGVMVTVSRQALDEVLAQYVLLFDALKDAAGHLDYVGYGDSYERECADLAKLPQRIDAALEAAR